MFERPYTSDGIPIGDDGEPMTHLISGTSAGQGAKKSKSGKQRHAFIVLSILVCVLLITSVVMLY